MWLGKFASAPLGVLLVFAHALGAACVSSSEGIRVELAARASSVASTVTTDRGYTVKLTRAHACIGSIEMLACEGAVASSPFALRVAHAHGTSSATKLATPAVLDLLGGTSSIALGALTPPPSRYCSLRVSLLAADADALGASVDAIRGRSLFVEGSWSSGGGPSHDLRVSATIAADTDVALNLDLREAKTVALVVAPSGPRWFDGIDFATESDAAIESKVVAAVASSIGVSAP